MNRPVIERNHPAFNPFVTFVDPKIAAIYADSGIRMNAITTGGDIQRALLDGDVAFGCIFIVAGFETITFRINRDIPIWDGLVL